MFELTNPETTKADEADDHGKGADDARDNQENEIEAEQESAAAMDADVPQPTDATIESPLS